MAISRQVDLLEPINLADHLEKVVGAWLGEQLSLHADPPGVRLRQLVDHGVTLSGSADTRAP